MNKIQKIFFVLTNLRLFRMLVSYYWNGYLNDIGWFISYRQQKPVGSNGQPIPWMSYPFIEFIDKRLDKTMNLIEYGSGNSTLFYSAHVKFVYAVEHDLAWYNMLIKEIPENVKLEYIALEYNGDYSKFCRTINLAADIVIVDGRDRVNCMKQSIHSLSKRGVVILDDSERAEYKEGINEMIILGYKRIDFWGIAPGFFNNKCTTIFYREGNCLNI